MKTNKLIKKYKKSLLLLKTNEPLQVETAQRIVSIIDTLQSVLIKEEQVTQLRRENGRN